MRSSRLLSILLHLQHRGGATAGDLAELTEVSVRTIYRDIAALQAAGVPLYTETGPSGGVRLLEGWQSAVEGLTADEAGVLFLAGVPGAAADLGMGPALAAAEVKLLAGLDPEHRRRATRVRQRFHVDSTSWSPTPQDLTALATLTEAVVGERRVDLEYHAGWSEAPPFQRRVDPLGLVVKAGTWYLVARHRGTVRSYRVSRVRSAAIRTEGFERPDDFDLASWWAASADAFDRSLLRLTITVKVDRGGRRQLPYVVPGGATREAINAAGEPDEDGWWTVTLGVESEDIALHQLTQLGAHVEVVEPDDLRRRLAEVGRAIAARNQ